MNVDPGAGPRQNTLAGLREGSARLLLWQDPGRTLAQDLGGSFGRDKDLRRKVAREVTWKVTWKKKKLYCKRIPKVHPGP